MTYHIHTETRSNLPEIIDRYFGSFTLTPSTGYWKGVAEPSTTIEITTDDRKRVWQLAQAIRTENHQEAVLVESQPTRSTLITAETPTDTWFARILRRRNLIPVTSHPVNPLERINR